MTADQPRRSRLRAPSCAARTLMLYALLGLISSILIAWALAAWVPYRSSHSLTMFVRESDLDGRSRWGFRHWVWDSYFAWGSMRRRGLLQGTDIVDLSMTWWFEWPSSRDIEPGLALALGGTTAWGSACDWEWGDDEPRTAVEDARGLPFVCLWQSIRSAEECTRDGVSADQRIIGGIPLGHLGDTMNEMTARGLPLRPIWPALAANSAIYGLMFFAVMRTFRTTRRLRRMTRGHCPRCAYDREGSFTSPCPECGWIPRRPDAPTTRPDPPLAP